MMIIFDFSHKIYFVIFISLAITLNFLKIKAILIFLFSLSSYLILICAHRCNFIFSYYRGLAARCLSFQY